MLTDDGDTVSALDDAAGNAGVRFNVFVKIDCGTHRVGVEPGSEAAFAIPRLLTKANNLDFAGILTHAGHSYGAKSRDQIMEVARHERDVMVHLAEALRGDGIEVPCVSIGSTPTMSLIDNLDGIDEIKVCVGYRLDGRQIDYLPAGEHAQAQVEPVYETIEGWRAPTARARSWAALPAPAIKYVRRIEELVGCPVALLSTSPERDDTILVTNPFVN